MDTVDEQKLRIEQARLDLDRKRYADELLIQQVRLDLEKAKLQSEGRFTAKYFGTLITALISTATIVVSISQVYVAYISKQNEIASSQSLTSKQLELSATDQRREWNLKATEFVAAHQDLIFSHDAERRDRIAKVMLITFPAEITGVLFQKLADAASDTAERGGWVGAQTVATKLLLVRVDGLYQRKDSYGLSDYLRFYPDGTILGVASPDTPAKVARWLIPGTDNQQGRVELSRTAEDSTFQVHGAEIKFSLRSKEGVVDYEGNVTNDRLTFDVYSHINQFKHSVEYEFVRNR